MDYAVIILVAALAAGLTFFSGFGLGTLLLPAFAVFVPVEVAVAATAVVHLVNSLFKVALMGRYADRTITTRFAIASAAGALVGAWVLGMLVGRGVLATYTISSHPFDVTLVKLVVGVLMIAFAIMELTPALSRWGLPPRLLWLGGVISGFFGGLSGHQGALRGAFLAHTDLSKDALVGTRAVCAIVVDTTRLLVYAAFALLAARSALPADQAADTLRTLHEHGAWGLIAAGCAAAIAGSLLGKRVLKEATISAVRITVAVMLLVLGVALGAGLV